MIVDVLKFKPKRRTQDDIKRLMVRIVIFAQEAKARGRAKRVDRLCDLVDQCSKAWHSLKV